MSRTARLLSILQSLRDKRAPTTAAQLADELGVSVRTIYRDLRTLVEQGASIEGEAGLGYVLKPGFFLPPLMFAEEEASAVILGLRLVMQRGDPSLMQGARSALAKVRAVLPRELEKATKADGMMVGPSARKAAARLAHLRSALRSEQRLRITYVNGQGKTSVRVIWPVALVFFDEVDVVAAWCETREAFRHFRVDRIIDLRLLNQSFPVSRRVLLDRLRVLEGLSADS
jgi:predicted DNA-binding transcriptional regulator YafY